MIHLRPISIKEAKRYIAIHHRHNEPPVGGLFAASVADRSGAVRGVAIVGRPKRLLQDGWTCELSRLCTDGARNACTMLYGASARAAKSLGYRRIVTYILASEPGTSLRAAGWEIDSEVKAEPTWDRPSRRRVQRDLFGNDRRPDGPKVRWRCRLAAGEAAA